MDFLKDKVSKKDKVPTFEVPSPHQWFDSFRSFIWETFKVIVISLAIIVPIRYFVIQPFYVKGASMEPNFFDQEYLIIDEVSYRFRQPERGEVIVFRYPRDPSNFFIKRIIGLPGDRVVIEDGQVVIYPAGESDGVILDESSYLSSDISTRDSVDVTLKLDEYYVLGDNRPASLDSRRFGPLDEAVIIGRVWLRGWPFDRFMIFATPEYSLTTNN